MHSDIRLIAEAYGRAIEKATDNPSDRCYKLCRCGTCGIERQCTPDFDFYGEAGEDLQCERCFRTELSDKHGIDRMIDQHGNTIHPEQVTEKKHKKKKRGKKLSGGMYYRQPKVKMTYEDTFHTALPPAPKELTPMEQYKADLQEYTDEELERSWKHLETCKGTEWVFAKMDALEEELGYRQRKREG